MNPANARVHATRLAWMRRLNIVGACVALRDAAALDVQINAALAGCDDDTRAAVNKDIAQQEDLLAEAAATVIAGPDTH